VELTGYRIFRPKINGIPDIWGNDLMEYGTNRLLLQMELMGYWIFWSNVNGVWDN